MAPSVDLVELGLEGGVFVRQFLHPRDQSRHLLPQGGNLIEDLGDGSQKRLDQRDGDLLERKHA